MLGRRFLSCLYLQGCLISLLPLLQGLVKYVTHFGSKRIAERYVKALFDVAQPAGALDAVAKDLRALTVAIGQSTELQSVLSNPLLARDSQADAFLAIARHMKAHELVHRFVALLAHQKRLPLLPLISELFDARLAHERGELQGELIAATPLSSKEVEQIGERLSKAYGRKITLDVRQDASLLGGMIIKIGSLQLDGSVAGKMHRLKRQLQAA